MADGDFEAGTRGEPLGDAKAGVSAELERWIQAGLLACWPSANNAPAGAVLDSTEEGIGRMTRGDGGKLRHAGQRLLNGLRKHPDPDGLVERTRRRLPSPTVESDRRHPTYPHRPSGTDPGERRPGGSGPRPVPGAVAGGGRGGCGHRRHRVADRSVTRRWPTSSARRRRPASPPTACRCCAASRPCAGFPSSTIRPGGWPPPPSATSSTTA